MKRILAPRASTILYSLLLSRQDARPYLLPANICPIVPITFLKARQPFEFIDISPNTLNMDHATTLERIRSGKTGGLLYAHTYGDPVTPADFFNAAKKADASILLIDDRCLCIPDLAPVSSEADVLLYSTGYAKVVDLGWGGYAFMQDDIDYRTTYLPYEAEDMEAMERAYKEAVAQRETFRYQDSDWLETSTDNLDWESYKKKIEDVLPASLKHRTEINNVYSSALPSELQLRAGMQMWRFQIRLPDPKPVLARLFSEKLFASSHYASLAGIMTPGCCPEAEKLASHILNLFNDDHYTVPMARRTCEIIMEGL